MSAAAQYEVTLTVDARGLSCPMPIVRARKGLDSIEVGQVMEVLATDKGAPADFRNWCQQTDQKFLGLVQEDGYFRMFIKKVVAETKEKGRVFPHEISNDQLAERVLADNPPVIVDVREVEEYEAGHIPGAIHVPIDQIEAGVPGVEKDAEVVVICRSGRRSDFACQILDRIGFARVRNVVPGMSEWKGPVTK